MSKITNDALIRSGTVCFMYRNIGRQRVNVLHCSYSMIKCVQGSLLSFHPGHNCHMGSTATKHPVSDRIKPPFVIFDIRALWRSVLSVRVLTLSPERQSAQMSKITNDALIRSGTVCFMYRNIGRQRVNVLHCSYSMIKCVQGSLLSFHPGHNFVPFYTVRNLRKRDVAHAVHLG